MRETLLLTSLLLLGAGTAAAQSLSRFTVGPVTRVDRIWIDGQTEGTTPVAGVAASVRISKAIAVEGELTGAARDIARSYEGWFVSYAQGPNVSRQEAEHFEDGINGDGNQCDHDRPNHVVSAHARHRNSLPADRIMESAKRNIAVGSA